MVAWTIPDLVDYYERRVEGLEDKAYSDFWEDEVLLLLTARDEIHDRWHELDSDQRSRILALDERLAKQYRRIARYGPVPNPNVTDRARWWWFLHEGPRVREKALAAARRAS